MPQKLLSWRDEHQIGKTVEGARTLLLVALSRFPGGCAMRLTLGVLHGYLAPIAGYLRYGLIGCALAQRLMHKAPGAR
ncbi:MAG: hypothetical protein ACREYF_10765 [Gammaproteobacteria bacterium]